MRIHLLRSIEYPELQYNEVLQFLNSFDGPISFSDAGSIDVNNESAWDEDTDEGGFYRQEFPKEMAKKSLSAFHVPEKRRVSDWYNIFDACNYVRKSAKIPAGEMLIILTGLANNNNWFSAADPNNRFNGFVHTAEWEYYVKCAGEFPVSYLVAALILQSQMFNDYRQLKKAVHESPMGCVNDFCEDKRNIILKLRTADICPDCLQLLDGKLNEAEIRQVLDTFEGVRLRILFHQKFTQNLKQSVLRITARGQILLPDFGNIEIRLTPLEKTLYYFFLRHPEGILLSHLVDHRQELIQIYSRFTTTGELPKIHKSIDDLVNASSNSASEKISKIKKAFVQALGQELSEKYIIQGERGEVKRVSLRSELICTDR